MIPEEKDPKWRALVLAKERLPFEFLPLRICLSMVKLEVGRDPSEKNIVTCIHKVHELLEKHERLAASDLKKIFG
jgi:hypothetical protein